MSRISFPTPETMNAEQRQVYDAIVSGPRARLVGPLRAALHNPELADRWQKMGALLRFGTSIPPRLSELAILVTARRWNSQIEWYIHATAAQVAGLPDAVIEAIRVAAKPVFNDADDAAIYEFARQLQQTGTVSENVYQEVLRVHKEAGVVEIAAIIGYYSMVSMTLNAHEIPMPDEGAIPPLSVVNHEPAGELPGAPLLTEMPAGMFVAITEPGAV
ncbi:carboxymuconolactone decarboxylase family protein [Glaciimonas sp. PCH181]|uniref:carboxymuconolactone decarboxylase family protein n=1 Tax=Glaciimonas sp. PCH181 TaxID=2133943 RepID=UPI001CED3A90|nr:carboxymuconolactone decarboxylase family protein [Glaciimonas sp. PCH181]